ncbi:HAD family hydrolase [Virgibacillus doumboii]|uniref:HAD family hydrolase n=1 Tax=Virgibacillus doumboii TaxID=2697503 RepID=UPI0013DFF15E|nr:HAD family hydrolase [Virgibacillus doumboii]
MDYKILFLDIDGTILKPDHTYTESTKHAISKAKEQGIEVFLATGRPLHEIDDLAEELDIHSFIGYNGAFAVYQNETIVNEPMNKNTVEQFLQTAEANDHEMVLYTRDKNYYTSLSRPLVTNFIGTFQLKKNLTWEADKVDQILGVTVMNLPPSETALYEIEANIFMSPVTIAGIENCYDIIRTNVNKGFAVEKILELLNINPKQAIAFGDGMNDKEMLQAAGEGFAMGNAHPDLFEYAKNRTTTVSEDGIYNGLKKLGLDI